MFARLSLFSSSSVSPTPISVEVSPSGTNLINLPTYKGMKSAEAAAAGKGAFLSFCLFPLRPSSVPSPRSPLSSFYLSLAANVFLFFEWDLSASAAKKDPATFEVGYDKLLSAGISLLRRMQDDWEDEREREALEWEEGLGYNKALEEAIPRVLCIFEADKKSTRTLTTTRFRASPLDRSERIVVFMGEDGIKEAIAEYKANPGAGEV